MKKLLATTAVALVAFAGAASAQSVLERVLSQIDNSVNLGQVNGTFANIAENIGGTSIAYFDDNTNTTYTAAEWAALDDVLTQSDYNQIPEGAYVNTTGTAYITGAAWALLSGADKAGYTIVDDATGYYYVDANGNVINGATLDDLYYDEEDQDDSLSYFDEIQLIGFQGINGSVNNVIAGLDIASMTALVNNVSAVEYLLPNIDLGNISTTVLGAVNTGEITLGVNQAVDEAKTTSTGALSAVVNQIGGASDTGALVLNIASNMTGVNGSINTTMTGVNGSVGNASTTVLGAVNTGAIVSGVNAAVTGIVGGSSQVGGLAVN